MNKMKKIFIINFIIMLKKFRINKSIAKIGTYLLQINENPIILPRSRGWLELLKANDVEWFPCRHANEICIRAAEANYLEAVLEQIIADENLRLVLDLVGDQKKEEGIVIAQTSTNQIIKMIRLLGTKILIIGRILRRTIKKAIQPRLAKNIFISVGVIATIAITVKIIRPYFISLKNKFIKNKKKTNNL